MIYIQIVSIYILMGILVGLIGDRKNPTNRINGAEWGFVVIVWPFLFMMFGLLIVSDHNIRKNNNV